MELIIKPTSRCNFNCKFCSASKLDISHSNKISAELKNYILSNKFSSLIITGGDPLMLDPNYYYELLELGTYNISFTTNLKDFYLNPNKWIKLFRNPRIGICTSFQYGSGRMWNSTTIYTEKLFKDVMSKFNSLIGYMPNFISVISNENSKYALDHVYLARDLNTKCKLNAIRSSGKSTENFPLYKLVDIWLDAIKLNLWKYIDTDIQFYNGGCGLNTSLLCEDNIRVFYKSSDGTSHISNCEDLINYNLDANNIPEVINDKCYFCELYRFCNGCKVNRLVASKDDEYCNKMLILKNKILSTDWKLF